MATGKPNHAQIATSRTPDGDKMAILHGHPVACMDNLNGLFLRHHGYVTDSTVRTINEALRQWGRPGRVRRSKGEMIWEMKGKTELPKVYVKHVKDVWTFIM